MPRAVRGEAGEVVDAEQPCALPHRDVAEQQHPVAEQVAYDQAVRIAIDSVPVLARTAG